MNTPKGRRKYVYRLVVDSWPTPDGKPFIEQPLEFWEGIAECASRPNHSSDECECPPWLPKGDDLAAYLPQKPGPDYAFYIDGPSHIRIITTPDDPPDPSTGYPGYGGDLIIAVPAAPTRRFMQRSGPAAMAKQLRQWGCTAHVERAEVGEWEPINA